jgi:hypothetical protein
MKVRSFKQNNKDILLLEQETDGLLKELCPHGNKTIQKYRPSGISWLCYRALGTNTIE